MHLSGHLEVIPEGRTTLLGQGLEGLSAFGNAAPRSYGLLATADGIASLANFCAVLVPRRAEQWRTTDVSTLGDLGADEISNVRASMRVPSDWQVAHVGSVLETVTASRNVFGVELNSYLRASERQAGEQVLDVASVALRN